MNVAYCDSIFFPNQFRLMPELFSLDDKTFNHTQDDNDTRINFRAYEKPNEGTFLYNTFAILGITIYRIFLCCPNFYFSFFSPGDGGEERGFERAFKNIERKEENAGRPSIFSFYHNFFYVFKKEVFLWFALNLSFADASSLDKFL